jgi:hypothetical protein
VAHLGRSSFAEHWALVIGWFEMADLRH